MNLFLKELKTAYNMRLTQWRVTLLIERSTSHQLLWFNESLVLLNPLLSPSRKPLQACRDDSTE